MKCDKCGYNFGEFHKKNGYLFCDICYILSPSKEKDLKKYVEDKTDYAILDTFRRYFDRRIGKKQIMAKKASEGRIMSRPPFGYKVVNKNLVPSENATVVKEIFEEFAKENISLRSLARKKNLSVNGLKKILRNFSYLGKIKFDKQVYKGSHQPIISPTLFNIVQDKLETKKR